FIMMGMSYWGGQKFYPIPYNLKKITGYILLSIVLVIAHRVIADRAGSDLINLLTATLLLGGFILYGWREIQRERISAVR
ncbi:MAG: hypothetical protein RL750_999, partial [Bacteroidota bacterium]